MTIQCLIQVNLQFFLQKRIACLHGIEDEFNLYCNGSLLTDEACVGELPSNVLDLTVPLRGGKLMSAFTTLLTECSMSDYS